MKGHTQLAGWSFRSVSWKAVFGYQTWGQLLLLVAGGIVTALSHFFNEPMDRPAYIYDAQASNALASHDTVPDAWAAIFPWVAFFVTITLVEFVVGASLLVKVNGRRASS
jgi:hypothetical protein